MTNTKRRTVPRTRTLTERAYEIIKRGILRGEIEEGSFLSEAEVMRKYRIGRTPFREACNRLHHEQLLEVVPRRGYLVSEISFRSVREIFEVRLLLEGVIAELAAVRAAPSEIDELEEVARRMLSLASSNGNHEEVVKANTQFHLCVAKMTHNRELLRLITGILERTERLSYLELRSSRLQKTDIQILHKQIVEAIRRRDAVAARKAVVGDIAQGEIDIFGGHGVTSDSNWVTAELSKAGTRYSAR
jgi:DNA-binding GntR family transcriptional regulator